jgi:hypothetical protein
VCRGPVVLDLDRTPVPVTDPPVRDTRCSGVVVGADGFSVAAEPGQPTGFKLGDQV